MVNTSYRQHKFIIGIKEENTNIVQFSSGESKQNMYYYIPNVTQFTKYQQLEHNNALDQLLRSLYNTLRGIRRISSGKSDIYFILLQFYNI